MKPRFLIGQTVRRTIDGSNWVVLGRSELYGDFIYHLSSDGREIKLLEKYLRPLDTNDEQNDDIDHPSHYTQYPVEVIEITENLNFLLGNVVKYVLRCDHKGEPIKDLKKAAWYLNREITKRENSLAATEGGTAE